jgi:hypothetical protein
MTVTSQERSATPSNPNIALLRSLMLADEAAASRDAHPAELKDSSGAIDHGLQQRQADAAQAEAASSAQ